MKYLKRNILIPYNAVIDRITDVVFWQVISKLEAVREKTGTKDEAIISFIWRD